MLHMSYVRVQPYLFVVARGHLIAGRLPLAQLRLHFTHVRVRMSQCVRPRAHTDLTSS